MYHFDKKKTKKASVERKKLCTKRNKIEKRHARVKSRAPNFVSKMFLVALLVFSWCLLVSYLCCKLPFRKVLKIC